MPDVDGWRRIINELPSVRGEGLAEAGVVAKEGAVISEKAVILTSPSAVRGRTRQLSAIPVGMLKRGGKVKKDAAVVVVSGDDEDVLEGASARGRPRRKRDVIERPVMIPPLGQGMSGTVFFFFGNTLLCLAEAPVGHNCLLVGVEAQIPSLREELSHEALAERLSKRARRSSAAVDEVEGCEGPMLQSGVPDTSRDAIEALILHFLRERRRVSGYCYGICWA